MKDFYLVLTSQEALNIAIYINTFMNNSSNYICGIIPVKCEKGKVRGPLIFSPLLPVREEEI